MSNEDYDFLIAKAELEEALVKLRKTKPNLGKEPPYCSFCGNGKNEYLYLIEGNRSAKICDQCVFGSYDLLKKEIENEK